LLKFSKTDTMADPATTDIHGGAQASTEAASGGLPQFDTTVWAGQIVYLLILFVALYLLISKVFAPRIRRVMDEREGAISTAIATARSVQAEAATQAAAAKAEVEKARADSRAASIAAKARIVDETNRRAAEEEDSVNARIAEAEAAIGRTRDAAMTNVGLIAADTTRAIVERLTGLDLTPAEADAAVAAVRTGGAA
jgi:F-type H+-transporting ATPase subunit b